mgnify:CR=1 FL=1
MKYPRHPNGSPYRPGLLESIMDMNANVPYQFMEREVVRHLLTGEELLVMPSLGFNGAKGVITVRDKHMRVCDVSLTEITHL